MKRSYAIADPLRTHVVIDGLAPRNARRFHWAFLCAVSVSLPLYPFSLSPPGDRAQQPSDRRDARTVYPHHNRMSSHTHRVLLFPQFLSTILSCVFLPHRRAQHKTDCRAARNIIVQGGILNSTGAKGKSTIPLYVANFLAEMIKMPTEETDEGLQSPDPTRHGTSNLFPASEPRRWIRTLPRQCATRRADRKIGGGHEKVYGIEAAHDDPAREHSAALHGTKRSIPWTVCCCTAPQGQYTFGGQGSIYLPVGSTDTPPILYGSWR